ncbi:hypothetical protein F5B17DRAFT_424654 [Nemania serpens]|nr:hypothetical protein F5B17DRAFT_424654 [Nemania serpens]
MTVVNKYVVSGPERNLNFFYLAVQVNEISRSSFTGSWSLTSFAYLRPCPIIRSLVPEYWSSANPAQNFLLAQSPVREHDVWAQFSSCYCLAWCLRATTSTTYSMGGALNKLPLAISGLIFFVVPVTVGSVSAIIVGFVSGMLPEQP